VTKKHHWTGEVDPSKYYGFVYLITNTVTGRKYIGRKFYHTYKKRIRIRQSNWRVYTGSCKPLLEDIERLGKDKFSFEIICNYKTRGGVVSGEVHFQTDNDVLSPELLPCGDRLYYNGHIGAVKFITPEYHSAETRAKMVIAARKRGAGYNFEGKIHSSESKKRASASAKKTASTPEVKAKISKPRYRGPYLITFKDGHTEEWRTMTRDGYDAANIYSVFSGKREIHKDIVKVERISPDDE
tara:strand:+ start:459 stop:1181 length:723 start_codon:yes stop_codon:yes gene_type:complete